MARLTLGKALLRRQAVRALIDGVAAIYGSGVQIWDPDGNLLLSAGRHSGEQARPARARIPILYGGAEVAGYVSGGGSAAPIAQLLSFLMEKEAEKKSLALELIDLYREINLLYNLTERSSASLEVPAVAQLALNEASRLIPATSGMVLLPDEQGELRPVAQFGPGTGAAANGDLAHQVAAGIMETGRAKALDAPLEPAPATAGGGEAVVGAPLKTRGQPLGAILLSNAEATPYSAGHLKLLNTLGSQVAPAIENALLHEQSMREAREREERLQRQIRELHIELDEQRQRRRVAEITETERFQELAVQAAKLRQIIDGEAA